MDVQVITRRLAQMQAQRAVKERFWRDAYDFTYPDRGAGFRGIDSAPRTPSDSTATDAVRMLASSIMSGLTPANARWFKLDVGDDDDASARWLDSAAELIWRAIHSSNFDAEAYETSLDMVIAGWAALFVDEDRERGGLVFEQWPIASVYCSQTRRGGLVDVVYRLHDLTAEQAVREFGDSISEKVRDMAVTRPDERVQFIHAIYPRVDGERGRRADRLPVASVHIEVDAKRVVRESGYHEMPVIVPRWLVAQGTPYGIGPVTDAMPDIRTVNELIRLQLAAADIAVSGMWIAEDDGVLNPRTVKIGPRKIVVANSVDSMKPLQTGANFQISDILINQHRAAIRKMLMADQLQPQDGPAMTATEVHVRQGLIRQLLGPLYGRLQAEYLQPLIERCFGLAFRAGALGDQEQLPPSLVGREFSVKYISPMARAQKLEDVAAIERFMANLGQLAQIDAGVIDLIDKDAATRFVGQSLGVPDKLLLPVDEVAAMREQKAQMAQEQQQSAMMQQLAMQGAGTVIDNMAAQAPQV